MAQSDTSSSPALTALIACLVGIALGLVLTRALSLVPSTLLNALVLAGGARISRSCHSPSRWWALIGAATGTLIGNGWVLTLSLQQNHRAEHLPGRLATVLVLCGAGVFAALESHLPPWRSGCGTDLLQSSEHLPDDPGGLSGGSRLAHPPAPGASPRHPRPAGPSSPVSAAGP